MNPDILAAIVAYLRSVPAIVAAFAEDLTATPQPVVKFWTLYAGPTDPAKPYLVVGQPQSRETYETANAEGDVGPVSDGTVPVHVWASSEDSAWALADQVAAALRDAPLDIAGQALIYFRPVGHATPLYTEAGVDGQPTTFGRAFSCRFITEPA